MLQNPSKYHPNPFSHFLALHSSQAAAAHNSIVHHPQLTAMPPVAAAAAAAVQNQFHHHQQQQQQQQPYNSIHQSTCAATNQQHSHPFQLQQHQHIQQQQQQHNHHPESQPPQQRSHLHSPQHLIDATANTSLDVGKSFTIAAILGLQKSALESSRKEYNNAINLSLSGSGNDEHISRAAAAAAPDSHQLRPSGKEMDKLDRQSHCNNANNKNDDVGKMLHSHNNNNTSNINMNNNNSNNSFRVVNGFNCDSSAEVGAAAAAAALMHRYLPVTTALAATSSAPTPATPAAVAFVAAQQQNQQQQQIHQHQQQQQQLLSHVRAVATAAAASAAVVVSGAPSALQSLQQQLHQHHAQQNTLAFQRDKHKTENSSKKSSLKNKRVRTIFTPEQLERLEAEFERQQYMVGPERLYLAHTLQLTEAQVKVWFQNRRIKWRKHHLEVTQQRLAMLRQSQLPATSSSAVTAAAVAAAAVVAVAAGSSVNNNNADNVNTRSSSPLSCGAEEVDDLIGQADEMRPLSRSSRQASESDLSVCNDSMDADSLLDGGGEDT